MDDWNRSAIKALLTDAECTLQLANKKALQSNPGVVPDVIAHARQNYIDLVRRSRPLTMTDGEYATFQTVLAHIRAVLRSFGESV